MGNLEYFLCFIILLYTIVFLSGINGQVTPHRKFEYRYSFKPPYLAQKDGTVPFWEYGGNAIASSENVRVAPSLRSQKGAIWTRKATEFEWWEVDIVFRVTGRGRIGADGLAFWYTESKGAYEGEVFGSSDKWVGLGIFFDSFDNDNKHNNPYIMGVVNNGQLAFDHQNDGTTQLLAGCLRDFRNKPFPTRARIEYYQNVLTLLFHNGMTSNDGDYEMCFRAEQVLLPKHGYFGVSAATGGLADDHDVLHFLTTSLWSPGQQPTASSQVSSDEQQRLSDEYKEYQRKLEQQKEDYKKEHPEHKVKETTEVYDWFETDNQRELKQIFQGQSQMYEALRELNRKLDEIVGRQERTLSLISHGGGAPAVPPGHGPPQPGQMPPQQQIVDSIRRHEVDAMFNNQNQLINAVREVKQFVGEVNARAETILTNQAKQPTAQVQAVGYDMQSLVSEMRDGLNHVKVSVGQVAQKIQTPPPCPTVSCVSVTTILIITAVQLIILLGYSIYRDNKDTQAKKFY